MQHNRKRERTGKRARLSVSLLERIQPDAAGIDCGQNSHFVAVPPDRYPTVAGRALRMASTHGGCTLVSAVTGHHQPLLAGGPLSPQAAR